MRKVALVTGLVALLFVVACDRQQELTPPATGIQPTQPPSGASATTQPEATPQPPADTAAPAELRETPAFQIVERVPGADGDELVVLLDEGTYDDFDIELLMVYLVDEFGPLAAHVVDHIDAVPLVLADDVDLSHELLADHYFAQLESGNRVTYMGPLSEFGWFLVGS